MGEAEVSPMPVSCEKQEQLPDISVHAFPDTNCHLQYLLGNSVTNLKVSNSKSILILTVFLAGPVFVTPLVLHHIRSPSSAGNHFYFL